MAERIDAHHHLWRYNPDEYSWIGPEMEGLQRDFLPSQLAEAMQQAGVNGAVAVQARQSVVETEWLLDLADHTKAIRGVVGWLPLTSPELPQMLLQFRDRPKLKGLRHVVQDEPDDRFILRGDFDAGIASLADTGLVYDLLIHSRHLPQAAELVRLHPQQVFVLDHLAKPSVRAGIVQPWADDLHILAENPNVYCKLSGLVTEADWEAWTPAELIPYMDAALDAFGPERLLAGSDWPVCLLASSYVAWWSLLEEWAGKLRPEHRDAVLGGTATRVYRL